MGVVLFILVAVYLLYLAIKGKGKIYSLERIYEDKVKLHVKQVRILLFIDAAMLLGVSALELLGIFEDMVWLRFVLGAVIIAPLIAIPALTCTPTRKSGSSPCRRATATKPGTKKRQIQAMTATKNKGRRKPLQSRGQNRAWTTAALKIRFTILTPRTLSKSIDKRD